MTTSRVGQILHLEKTNLIKTSGKDVDNMPIICGTFGEVVVKLASLVLKYKDRAYQARLTLTAFLKYLTLSRSMS